jgi:hypothetical protein
MLMSHPEFESARSWDFPLSRNEREEAEDIVERLRGHFGDKPDPFARFDLDRLAVLVPEADEAIQRVRTADRRSTFVAVDLDEIIRLATEP